MNAPKNKNVCTKVTNAEYEIIFDKAKKNNMTVSEFLRERVLFDVPNIEHHSFEFKALKGISYCVGILASMSEAQLSGPDKVKAENEALRIMKSYGLDESHLKLKID